MRRPPIVFETSTALVTGAGSGIGRATAHSLAAEGATVLCTDIDEAAAEKTAAECGACSSSGPGSGSGSRDAHRAYRLDVTDRSEASEGLSDITIGSGHIGKSAPTTPRRAHMKVVEARNGELMEIAKQATERGIAYAAIVA